MQPVAAIDVAPQAPHARAHGRAPVQLPGLRQSLFRAVQPARAHEDPRRGRGVAEPAKTQQVSSQCEKFLNILSINDFLLEIV